jgi:hypothetical protein
MQNTTATLRHGQTIRVAGFSKYANRITVGTARGYASQYGEDAEASHSATIANGHDTAWANQEPSMLTADYTGKDADLAATAEKIASAPVIHNGQQVEIEGEIFTVRVTGERYCDPVHFKRIA